MNPPVNPRKKRVPEGPPEKGGDTVPRQLDQGRRNPEKENWP